MNQGFEEQVAQLNHDLRLRDQKIPSRFYRSDLIDVRKLPFFTGQHRNTTGYHCNIEIESLAEQGATPGFVRAMFNEWMNGGYCGDITVCEPRLRNKSKREQARIIAEMAGYTGPLDGAKVTKSPNRYYHPNTYTLNLPRLPAPPTNT